MRVYIEIEGGEELRRYCLDHSWSGAAAKVNRIEEREDYLDVWDQIYQELEDDVLEETALNDAIWFDEEINKIIYPEEYEEEEEEEEEEDNEEDNEASARAELAELKAAFDRLYKECTLYAIHLDGFTHSVFYKDAAGDKHIDKYSECAPELYDEDKQEQPHCWRSFNTDRVKMLFAGYPNYAYQGAARELVYMPVDMW